MVYIAALTLGAVGIGVAVRQPEYVDVATLMVGTAVAFFMEAAGADTVAGVNVGSSSSGFVHLTMRLLGGPMAAALCAVAGSVSAAVRYRSPVSRLLFNASNYFISNVAAWAVFRLCNSDSVVVLGGAAALAGIARNVVNTALLAAVVRIADPSADIRAWLRTMVAFLPYAVGYGWAAYGAVLLHENVGAVGITFVLVPVVLVQVFLVMLGKNIAAAERRREAHVAERESLLRRVNETSAIERARISRDLHDGVVQDLGAMIQLLGRMADDIDTASPARLHRAVEAAEESVNSVRTLARELTPPALAVDGLTTVLSDLARTLQGNGTRVEIVVDPDLDGDERGATAYRIVQEALRNVSKHAQARHVEVLVNRAGDALRIVVADDGIGFAPREAEAKRREGHLGLQVLRDLAAVEHGSVDIASTPGAGTTVTALIPWVREGQQHD